jgi:uncharacterized protein YerC
MAQRIQCLTLLAEGYPGKDIQAKIGVSHSAQTKIKEKAYERGFDPIQDAQILEEYDRCLTSHTN